MDKKTVIAADDPRTGWYYVEISDPELEDVAPTRMWCLYDDDKYFEKSRSSTRRPPAMAAQ